MVPRVREITKCQLEAERAWDDAWEVDFIPYVFPLSSRRGIFEVLVFDSSYYLVLINLLKPLCVDSRVSCEGHE